METKNKQHKQKIIAIIPARGGSKGIPHKNIKMLAGKPLIAWTIEQSRNSKLVSRTIVSTDDEKIAAVAKKYGAEVIMRPMELARDTTPTEPVLQHVLDVLKEKEKYIPEYVVLLQCTSPLREKNDIDNAIATLQKEQADSLLSVCKNHAFLWEPREQGKGAAPLNYDFEKRPRRQEMQQYRENGSIYVTKTEILKKEKNRLWGKIALYVMGDMNSNEVDEPFDFLLIEKILEHKKESH